MRYVFDQINNPSSRYIDPVRSLLALKPINTDPAALQEEIRALQTMPEPMAQYEGIAARERLIDLIKLD